MPDKKMTNREKKFAETNEFIYAHVRLNNGGVVTFCIEQHLDKTYNEYIDYNVAYCSPQDQFCKAKGRSISRARKKTAGDTYGSGWEDFAFNGQGVERSVGAYQTAVIDNFFEWVKTHANDIHCQRPVPRWVRYGKVEDKNDR